MKLIHLLEALKEYDLTGDPEQEIEGLAYDSRRVQPGDLFVALRGHALNGHHYLDDAVQNGALALVGEEFSGLSGNLTKVCVPDSREALSKLAARFYDYPFRGITLIGITGTNGKTTTSYLLESILTAAGRKPGVIGTINYRYLGKTHAAPVTTPESLDLMRFLREMADAGVTDVIMEVSSHALDQRRTGECPFKLGVFTNFSRDHLDYHKTMEEYFKAKSLLFQGLKKGKSEAGSTAVINMDDPRGEQLATLTEAPVVSYGLDQRWDVRGEHLSADKTGLKARLITPAGEVDIQSSLIGKMNIYNILAASAAALAVNVPLGAVAEGTEGLEVVPGRLELVKNQRGLNLVVDYAHTPDALLKTLTNLRPIVDGRLITVFGCGGDRDKGKRSEMGLVAGENSDLVFITSDNPRSEDPLSIIAQIEKGIRETGLIRLNHSAPRPFTGSGYFVEADRRRAICKAVALADEMDLVLIAGKGHEDYQIVGGEQKHFDDREEVARAASKAGH
ncbi:MAG: UDP-N-acetylmuramoyl-L-alanyl-D-glutamate--2,6-diaminopimelate ligase [Desulfobacteraceae bacterium]